MNLGIIIYMLGWIMKVEAVFMLLPVGTALIYRESIAWCYLGVAAFWAGSVPGKSRRAGSFLLKRVL